MKDICSDLDKLTVTFFDNLELLREKREHLNGAIRDGHLNLSKARYSMGNKSVGTLQYSHKMDCALYHVRDDFPHEQPVESFVAFELLKTSPGRHIEKPEIDTVAVRSGSARGNRGTITLTVPVTTLKRKIMSKNSCQ